MGTMGPLSNAPGWKDLVKGASMKENQGQN